eukprot:m.212114 g.212114  ORF g.212114 m.212114 type:complete len:306 (-) comp19034_c0_seq3:467-1384(-)
MSCCQGNSCGAPESNSEHCAQKPCCNAPALLSTEILFDNFVAAAGDDIVAVDMTASWCGPCKKMKPVFNGLASTVPDVKFGIVDIDSNQAVARRYNVTSVPTFLFIRNGILIDRFTGGDPKGLQQTLNSVRLHAFDVIRNGVRVRLRGLKAASSASLNSRCGVIQAFDPAKRRYTVKIDDSDRTVALKIDNLLQLCKQVTVFDDADGAVKFSDAEIVDVDDTATTYTVRAPSQNAVQEVPCERLVLPNGTIVCIQGLTGSAALNGTWGKICGYDKDAGRYLVQVEQNKQLKLKRRNVAAGPACSD